MVRDTSQYKGHPRWRASIHPLGEMNGETDGFLAVGRNERRRTDIPWFVCRPTVDGVVRISPGWCYRNRSRRLSESQEQLRQLKRNFNLIDLQEQYQPSPPGLTISALYNARLLEPGDLRAAVLFGA